MARAIPPKMSLSDILHEVARDDFLARDHRTQLRQLAGALDNAEVRTIKELQTRLAWATLWHVRHRPK